MQFWVVKLASSTTAAVYYVGVDEILEPRETWSIYNAHIFFKKESALIVARKFPGAVVDEYRAEFVKSEK